MTVTSKDNRLVREWRGLCRESHLRQKAGRFAIEGARLCGDALASGLALQTVLYTPQAQQTYAGTVAALTAACPSSAEITPELARYMADTDHPQGVFCTANFLDNRLSLDTIKRMGRYGILEDMQDPGNLGTVIRTAEALGLDGLILSAGCCDIYNPKVLRGTTVTGDNYWKGMHDHANALLMTETYGCPDPYALTEMEDHAMSVVLDRLGMLDRYIIIRDSVNTDVFMNGASPESLWDPNFVDSLASESSVESADIFATAMKNNFTVGHVVIDAILNGEL